MRSTCRDCVFWSGNRTTFHDGQCRAHAPEVDVVTPDAGAEARWPLTKPGDWCGDFEQYEKRA